MRVSSWAWNGMFSADRDGHPSPKGADCEALYPPHAAQPSDKGPVCVRCDEQLRPLFGTDSVELGKMAEALKSHLTPPEPVQLRYTIRWKRAGQGAGRVKAGRPRAVQLRMPLNTAPAPASAPPPAGPTALPPPTQTATTSRWRCRSGEQGVAAKPGIPPTLGNHAPLLTACRPLPHLFLTSAAWSCRPTR